MARGLGTRTAPPCAGRCRTPGGRAAPSSAGQLVSNGERYRIGRNAVFAELGDGTGVVLDLESKAYFTLNTTGVFVWKALAVEPSRLDELVNRLCGEFEVQAERALADVTELLRQLGAEALVERLAE